MGLLLEPGYKCHHQAGKALMSFRGCDMRPFRDADDHFNILFDYPQDNIYFVQAGLHIEKISRWHFGTTYIIIARPSQDASS